jgi:DNA-binding NtrC family response regulator
MRLAETSSTFTQRSILRLGVHIIRLSYLYLYSEDVEMPARDVELSSTDWILIVDDEFEVVTILRQWLEKQAFNVIGFTEPALALEYFRINFKKYGLVISDLRMPEINGYEFIKKVKKIKPEVKVFFMTAFEINDNEFRRLLPSVKIDEFIQKPISMNYLTTIIKKYISIGMKAKRGRQLEILTY